MHTLILANWILENLYTCLLEYLLTWTLAYLNSWIVEYLHTCILADLQTCILAYWHTCTLAYLHTLMHSWNNLQDRASNWYFETFWCFFYFFPAWVVEELALLKIRKQTEDELCQAHTSLTLLVMGGGGFSTPLNKNN